MHWELSIERLKSNHWLFDFLGGHDVLLDTAHDLPNMDSFVKLNDKWINPNLVRITTPILDRTSSYYATN